MKGDVVLPWKHQQLMAWNAKTLDLIINATAVAEKHKGTSDASGHLRGGALQVY